jgi:CRP-like cAMP-binding protein
MAATVEPPAQVVARSTTADRGTTISRAALLDRPVEAVEAIEPVVTAKMVSPEKLAAKAERIAAREAKRDAMKRAATLPPGGALDAIPLAAAMPDSQRIMRADGTDAGMAVLRIDIPFDDVADEDHDVEIEVVDPARVALLRTPIFAKLPATSLERLIGRLELRELAANEEVFHEGDAGTTLFVIAEGEVAVESHGNELAKLAAGTFFGEIALVTDLPRSATVRAAGRVELLAIDREVVREAAAEVPEIISVLLGFVRDRLVDRITRTSALFQPFTEDERAELAGRFELVEVDANAQLISQGARADGLYIVLAGRVEVARTGEPRPVATLGSGDVFGEISLMSAKGSTANVRAVSRVLALRLPATIFQEVIMTYPQVLAYLGELSASRSRLQQAEDILDLHIDLI